ncbi:zinc finger protein 154-like isoform X1 [Tachysurus ichikawai]
MESTEVRLCYSPRPPQAPAGSQLCEDVQTETCNDSDGGTSGSVGHEDHEKHIKKEEAEEEGYVCDAPSCPVGCITTVADDIQVKKEEPEDKDSLCGEASGSVETMEQHNRGFQMKCVKVEESDDEDYLCTTTVCG